MVKLIQELLDKIDFSSDNVVGASAETPRLFIKAGEYRIQCLRERNRAKMEHERIQADRGLVLRDEAIRNGDKMTEGKLEALLLMDKRVSTTLEDLNTADENDEFAKLLVEAFRMRRDVLEIIGRISGAEMAYQKAIEMETNRLVETRQKLKDKYPKG